MRTLGNVTAIAFGLAFTGAGLVTGTARAEEPCAGVDVDLADARQQQYAELIADAISEYVEPSERLQPSDVEVYDVLESGSWSAVYGSMPTADVAMFFFEEVDGVRQFQDVWGGWADPSERPDLIAWAENLGAPENLATCFAYVIIDDTSAGQSFGFTVALAFTTDALNTLTARREEVVVSASYYADPTPEGEEHADEIGRIDLGEEDVQVPARPGDVAITGSQVDIDSLQWTEGDVGVNVNVFTARLSSDDNLISCDVIDGPLPDVVAAMPVTLRCALIEEDVETELRP